MDLTKAIREMEKALRKKGVKNLGLIMLKAREARDEVKRLEKEGIEVNYEALKKVVFKPAKLLDISKHDKTVKIKDIVRNLSTITLTNASGDEYKLNYLEYITAKRNIENYNKSVEMWNKYHADEIAKDPNLLRVKKPFVPVGVGYTQHDVDTWIENAVKNFKTAKDYFQGLKGTYIRNLRKMIERTMKVNDDIIDAFINMLDKHLPKTGGDYVNITSYYGEALQQGIRELLKIARHYGFEQEFTNWLEDHNYSADIAYSGADSY